MEVTNHHLNLTNFVLLTSVLSILPLFTTCYEIRAIENLRNLEMLSLTVGAGPESIAFDPSGGGPYTGVSNGRILKWKGRDVGWAEFAFNLNHRDEECGVYNNEMMESKCGRPLGLQFHKATGNLYIADAYLGLLTVGPEGGPVTSVAAAADGVPFNFTNGVDIDQETGMVYFTDSSIHFQRRNYMMLVLSGDASGRLMRYDPATKRVTVIESGLTFPNGLVVSHDNTHLLVAMTSPCRILRYWLRGPRTGTFETFAELPGYPDNIKRNSKGEYWVALGQDRIQLNGLQERVTNFGSMLEHPIALRLSQEGRVLEVLNGPMMTSISEVEERDGLLWFGSVVLPYVGVYEA